MTNPQTNHKNRIYKYDNAKAILIFLVVVGHLTTIYASDSHLVRWITLWIYTFHMPAFIFITGLLHKRYATVASAGRTYMRWDRFWGYLLCGYGLKVFLYFFRRAVGQNPPWYWIAEPQAPWYLFVMAEYELLFWLLRRIDCKVKPAYIIAASFAISAFIGYFPSVGDTFCLARMINFLPLYALGYYADPAKVTAKLEEHRSKIIAWILLAVSVVVCCAGPWQIYRMRKWFTGRRSYEFIESFFPGTYEFDWAIRLGAWLVAIVMTFTVLTLIPDRKIRVLTETGRRTLQIYFWHRPICYWLCGIRLLPMLVTAFGGSYNESVLGEIYGHAFGGGALPMGAGLAVYLLIGLLITLVLSIKIFKHPTEDLMDLGRRIASITGERKTS